MKDKKKRTLNLSTGETAKTDRTVESARKVKTYQTTRFLFARPSQLALSQRLLSHQVRPLGDPRCRWYLVISGRRRPPVSRHPLTTNFLKNLQHHTTGSFQLVRSRKPDHRLTQRRS